MSGIKSCIVCEIIRPEAFGKLSLLGFFGVCPDVEIAVQNLDQSVILAFLLTGTIDAGTYSLSFAILDSTSDRVIASTDSKFTAVKGPVALPFAMMLVFGHSGQFWARYSVDGKEQFRASFRIAQAQPQTP